jgi:hypothetical protein
MLLQLKQIKNRLLPVPQAKIMWIKITMAFAIILEPGQAMDVVPILSTKTTMVFATTVPLPGRRLEIIAETGMGMATSTDMVSARDGVIVVGANILGGNRG